MEHWNHAFKQHLATAGGNVASSTIIRTGMALSTLNETIDEVTNISPQAVHHTTKSSKKDENTMLEALHSKFKYLERKDLISIFHHFLGTTSLRKSLKNGFKGT